jgi:hypothetical protein
VKGVTAIMIARGGSKRIPRKNVMDICGHPLIAWAIRQAVGCKYTGDVWVSTDDDEIEEISLRYGAKVIRRPDELAADNVCGLEVTSHAQHYLDAEGLATRLIISIMPTMILFLPGDMDRLVERYFEYKRQGAPENIAVSYSVRLQDVAIGKINEDECIEPLLWDKTNTLVDSPGGATVMDWGVMRDAHDDIKAKLAPGGLISDELMDSNFGAELNKSQARSNMGYCEIKPWQAYDINIARDIELVRSTMELRILQGRGIEIYG